MDINMIWVCTILLPSQPISNLISQFFSYIFPSSYICCNMPHNFLTFQLKTPQVLKNTSKVDFKTIFESLFSIFSSQCLCLHLLHIKVPRFLIANCCLVIFLYHCFCILKFLHVFFFHFCLLILISLVLGVPVCSYCFCQLSFMAQFPYLGRSNACMCTIGLLLA